LQLPPEALSNHVLEAPGLHEWFEGATESGNPDALLLALKIGENNSVEIARLGKLLPDPFSPSKLFSADHLSSLANCLKVLWVCAVVWCTYLSACCTFHCGKIYNISYITIRKIYF
jgi:DNA polymerase phi